MSGQSAHFMSRIAYSLKPVPPFRLDLAVWVLRRRPENLIDRWDGSCYRRVLALGDSPVEVAVTQTGPPETPRLESRRSASGSAATQDRP